MIESNYTAEQLEELEDELLICPINNTLMKEPVIASDGFVYELRSITEWQRNKKTSPMTREELRPEFIRCRALEELIERHAKLFVDHKSVKISHDEIESLKKRLEEEKEAALETYKDIIAKDIKTIQNTIGGNMKTTTEIKDPAMQTVMTMMMEIQQKQQEAEQKQKEQQKDIEEKLKETNEKLKTTEEKFKETNEKFKETNEKLDYVDKKKDSAVIYGKMTQRLRDRDKRITSQALKVSLGIGIPGIVFSGLLGLGLFFGCPIIGMALSSVAGAIAGSTALSTVGVGVVLAPLVVNPFFWAAVAVGFLVVGVGTYVCINNKDTIQTKIEQFMAFVTNKYGDGLSECISRALSGEKREPIVIIDKSEPGAEKKPTMEISEIEEKEIGQITPTDIAFVMAKDHGETINCTADEWNKNKKEEYYPKNAIEKRSVINNIKEGAVTKFKEDTYSVYRRHQFMHKNAILPERKDVPGMTFFVGDSLISKCNQYITSGSQEEVGLKKSTVNYVSATAIQDWHNKSGERINTGNFVTMTRNVTKQFIHEIEEMESLEKGSSVSK